jgi:hypothetical protein
MIGRRVLFCELGRDYVQRGFRLLETYIRPWVRKHLECPRVPFCPKVLQTRSNGNHTQRNVCVQFQNRNRTAKTLVCNTDHGEAPAIQFDILADDIRVAAKFALPKAMSKNDDWVGA